MFSEATKQLYVAPFYRIFWSFQGRQIGGLQRVKPNYAHPFALRASFFGAKPTPQKSIS